MNDLAEKPKQFNTVRILITLLIGTGIWFSPQPSGVTPEAWHLLAIFVSTISGIILKILPMGAVAVIGIAVTALTGVLDPKSPSNAIAYALSGFANTTIWLIVLAFFIARGFIKTGLGSRIAFIFVKFLGKRTLGLSYGLLGADLILAPAIPSNTARAGGIIYPIMKSLAMGFGSDPDKPETRRKMGAYLTITAYHGNIITSAMFMTAMAANPLAAKLATDAGFEITWGLWALAAIVPGLVSLAVVPYLLYKLYPPEIKQTPEAPDLAKNQLDEMGPMTMAEWIMMLTFIMLIGLWVFGGTIGIHGTTAGILGLSVLLFTQVLTWEDIIREKGAWDTLVWFAALVMMATYLNKLGMIAWFGQTMESQISGISWTIAFPVIVGVYFYSHYFFASSTAHVSAMYAAFLAVGVAVGVPGMLLALTLGFVSNLYAVTTHYGMGPAPVLFGSGYVELKTWWVLGFIMSIVFIIIWMGIGGVWWKVIGLY
ncbi:MAG: anion permease [Deltaproteobacteria bacterium]|nr:MAG: anion permease [Deltaproteobacteria bacterium]